MRWLRVMVALLLILPFLFLSTPVKGWQVEGVTLVVNNFLNNSTAKALAWLTFDSLPKPPPAQVENVIFNWTDPDGALVYTDVVDPDKEAVAWSYHHVDRLGEWRVNVSYEGNFSIWNNKSFDVVTDHWGPGTYVVSRTTLVSVDATLTIEPGTIVAFDDNKSLGVEGRLVAQGIESDPIVFTSNLSTKSPGDWGSITFYDSSDDLSVIAYVRIEYSREGLTLSGASPALTNSTFINNSERAIYAELSSSLIRGNSIAKGEEGISPVGIFLAGSDLTLEDNFVQNMSIGMYLLNSNVLMRDNVVENCDPYGMFASNTIIDSTSDRFSDNRNGVELDSGSDATFEDLIIAQGLEGFSVFVGSHAILWNSTVELVETLTFELGVSSSVILVNSSFSKSDSSPGISIPLTDDSVLMIRNFLTVEVLSYDSGTHIADASVEVFDGESLALLVVTGLNGFTQPLVVTDRTYYPTLVENTTLVRVAFGNLRFENNNRSVQMSSGHIETFRGSIHDMDGDGEPDFSDNDMDGDELTNGFETGIGTNPANPDTDGDEIPDGFEFAHSGILDPLNGLDAASDYDQDGLSNLEEYVNGTYLGWGDCDADGVDDGLELGCGMNPLNNSDADLDWDEDGFSNGRECEAGTDLLDSNDYPSQPSEFPISLLVAVVSVLVVVVVVVVVVIVLVVLMKRRKPPVDEVSEEGVE